MRNVCLTVHCGNALASYWLYANASFFIETIVQKAGVVMRNDKLSVQSMDFAASVINLVRYLKENKEHIISNQIGRSGTSIGANIREIQYAHG